MRSALGRPVKGVCESSNPSNTLVGRERTWAVMRSPSRLASSISVIVSRQPSGRALDCNRVMVTGRPDSFARRRNRATSPSWKSDTICSQPASAWRIARAIAVSSASSARRVGMCLPSAER